MPNEVKKETPKKLLSIVKIKPCTYRVDHGMENSGVSNVGPLLPDRLSKLLFKLEAFGLTVTTFETLSKSSYYFTFYPNTDDTYKRIDIKRLIKASEMKSLSQVYFKEIRTNNNKFYYIFNITTSKHNDPIDSDTENLMNFYSLTDELKSFNQCIDRLREDLKKEEKKAKRKEDKKKTKKVKAQPKTTIEKKSVIKKSTEKKNKTKSFKMDKERRK